MGGTIVIKDPRELYDAIGTITIVGNSLGIIFPKGMLLTTKWKRGDKIGFDYEDAANPKVYKVQLVNLSRKKAIHKNKR